MLTTPASPGNISHDLTSQLDLFIILAVRFWTLCSFTTERDPYPAHPKQHKRIQDVTE